MREWNDTILDLGKIKLGWIDSNEIIYDLWCVDLLIILS